MPRPAAAAAPFLRLVLLVMLVLVSRNAFAPALAHDPGMSAATLVPAAHGLEVELSVKAIDVETEGGIDLALSPDGMIDPAVLAARQADVAAYLLERTEVSHTGGACTPASIGLQAVEDGILAFIGYPCGLQDAGLRYATRLLHDLAEPTVQTVLVVQGEGSVSVALDNDHPGLLLGDPPGPATTFAVFFRSGIIHLFIGFDHIAFVVALVLWADRWWPVVKVVTAFTLAHSLTLALAAFRLVELPSALVEAVIALSVMLVALENFISRDISVRVSRAFLFGLVHGFGFASVLGAQVPGKDGLLLGILSFNLGVEAGQLLIVAAVMSILFALDRVWLAATGRPGRPVFLVRGISALIACLGAFWLISRLAASA